MTVKFYHEVKVSGIPVYALGLIMNQCLEESLPASLHTPPSPMPVQYSPCHCGMESCHLPIIHIPPLFARTPYTACQMHQPPTVHNCDGRCCPDPPTPLPLHAKVWLTCADQYCEC